MVIIELQALPSDSIQFVSDVNISNPNNILKCFYVHTINFQIDSKISVITVRANINFII